MSAYTYGNILALGALVLVAPADIEHGHALILLLATGFTTLLAHGLAELQEHRLLHWRWANTSDYLHALRNSVPILSSTSAPAVALLLAMADVIPPQWAWYLAIFFLIARFFSLGFVISHFRKEKISFRTLVAGIIFAAVGLGVALLKAVLTH